MKPATLDGTALILANVGAEWVGLSDLRAATRWGSDAFAGENLISTVKVLVSRGTLEHRVNRSPGPAAAHQRFEVRRTHELRA